MAKFCGKCGARLDEKTGKCPNCDIKKGANYNETADVSLEIENEDRTSEKLSGRKNLEDSRKDNRQQKKEKKSQRKAAKKEKQSQWSTSKKLRRFLLKFILIFLLLIILASGAAGVLVYFEIVDIPVISYVLERSGLVRCKTVDIDPLQYNYIPEEDSIVFDENTNMYYANNELVVVFSLDATEEQKENVISFLNGELAGSIPEINMYQITIGSSNTLEELNALADQIMSEFDYVLYATYDTLTINQEDAYAPDDPWNGDVTREDWEDDTIDGSNWGLEAIEVQDAWDYSNSFSRISIGISDSSFDTGHEDLKNVVSFPNEVLESRNVVTPWWDNSENFKELKTMSVREQENYHGTHVAGIIGAEGDNGKGITGTVQNCELLLAPYYRSENMEAYLAWDTSTYANLSYLVKAGAKVLNFSQGKTNFLEESTGKTSFDSTVIEREGNLAAVSISQLIASGFTDFIVVQSSGNGIEDTGKAVDAIQNGWFASITDGSITGYDDISIHEVRSHVIIVGAVEQTSDGFQCTSFSNFGDQVNVCAPGDKIYSTIPGEIFYDFQFSGGYGYERGTSMAAPVVTGVCALVWSANESLSAEQVKNIVCNSSSVVVSAHPESESDDSYNMVNAKLSVEAALNYTAENNSGMLTQQDIPSDAVEFNGHYYYLYTGGIASTYEEALQFCADKGGYLATLTSQEENDFVYSYITQQNCESAYFGFSDSESEGIWEWCTGEPVSYTNWHSGEPNKENPNEDYGMLYYKYSDGSWNDGDFGNNTVNGGTAFICEWGDYQQNTGSQTPGRTTSDERNIVLVLDRSGSMEGTPIQETIKASTDFVDTILEEDASIGVVTYDSSAERNADFSMDKSFLTQTVSEISSGGGTNMESGLQEAQQMLANSNAKKKIIVLMSDGMPNDGKQGEELIAYADEIKDSGTLIYTLGFFENMGSDKSSAQYLMEELASDGCHYEVASADDLVFFFGDIADQINGQKYIYVRIACPVDVSVTYEGETLNSSDEDLNVRTDFGTLTFEESESEQSESEEKDDRIKVLRLKEGADYDLEIVGTGYGTMNYTIGFMDDDGNYDDFRRFENIRITKRTKIDTVAEVSSESILNIDDDGDGKYDTRLRAEENGYGEEVKTPEWVIFALGGAGILIFIDISIFIVLRMRKRAKRGRE